MLTEYTWCYHTILKMGHIYYHSIHRQQRDGMEEPHHSLQLFQKAVNEGKQSKYYKLSPIYILNFYV